MGSRHHYVPAFIIREWIPGDVRLLELPAKAAEVQEALRSKLPGSTRKMMVRVWEESRGTTTPRPIDRVMSEKGFYRLAARRDPTMQGRLLYMLRMMEEAPPGTVGLPTNETFAVLAREWSEAAAERLETHHTQRQDNRLAGYLRRVASGDELQAEFDDFRRSLELMRTRTPGWKKDRFPKIADNLAHDMASVMHEFIRLRPGFWEGRIDVEEFIGSIKPHLFALQQVVPDLGYEGSYIKHQIGVAALHATGGARFVLSDNPLRNFDPDRLGRTKRRLMPGLGDQRVVAAFSISPTICLLAGKAFGTRRVEHINVSDREVQRVNAAQYYFCDEALVLPESEEQLLPGRMRLRRRSLQPRR